jgi:predicted transcriptional regulator
MAMKSIGDRELALLRHIEARGSATVGEVAEEFGRTEALARSTVLTMMERLRNKGHLSRRLADGVYRYSPRAATGDVVRRAVHAFVDKTLGGSLSPLATYLAERGEVSEAELAELEDAVERLQARSRRRTR